MVLKTDLRLICKAILKKNLFLLIALLIICNTNFKLRSETSPAEAAKIREQLSKVKSPNDSIKLLYDVYDNLPKKEKAQVAKKIYEIATRTGNTPIRLDILRLTSVIYDDDKTLNQIIAEVKKIPASQEQKEVIEYIKMRMISSRSKSLSEKDRQREIVKILHGLEKNKGNDNLRDILDLYTLVEFMRNDASGDMIKKYLDRLQEMIDRPDIKAFYLKNLVYSEIASVYSDVGDHQKAIAANKKALEMVGKLEQSYRDSGRTYSSYDISRYVIYRRMLRNAAGLQPGEAQNYYDMAMQLAKVNSDVKEDIEENPRLTAYYLMATEKYKAAIPVLKEALEQPQSIPIRKQLLEMLILASEKTGDNATRMDALVQYTDLLKELNELQAAEKSRELQIKYDLKDLKNRNHVLEVENKEQEIDSERSIMTFVTVAFVIIFIILIFMLINWGRYKKNTSRMGRVVDNMHNERYNLRETLYNDKYDLDPLAVKEVSNNLQWEKRMKLRGEKRGDATIFMTESIVNDLLYIAWVGHKNLIRHLVDTSADKLMHNAESRAQEKIKDFAPLTVEYPEKDFNIHTDAECLEALLAHLFLESTSYEGTINVTCSAKVHDEKNFDLVITLMGIPPASSEGIQIFKDMPISDILLNHKNSGLYVCRMISMLMQCELIPDKTYKDGARYILRIPITMES